MITENISTLKINKLTKAQYERELAAGRIDENALYLTPDEGADSSGDATALQRIIYQGSDDHINIDRISEDYMNSNLKITGRDIIFTDYAMDEYPIIDTLNNKSDQGHKHSASDITSGTLGAARLPAATSSALGGVKVGNNITNSSGTISLTKSNVTTALGYTPPTTDTTYNVVSTTADGLAPKRDGSTTKFLRADGTWATPPDTDTNTHYTTGITAGASGTTSNSATSNPYVKIKDDSTHRSQIQIKGSGATSVSSDANGVITISSTDNDTTYTSLKNPYSLTIQGNGTTLTNGTYDGSAAKTVNITPASIGAQVAGSYVDTTSAQTVGGVKTFSSGIKIGNATLSYDSTNEALVITI